MEEVLVVRGQGAGGGAGERSPLIVFGPLAPVVHGVRVVTALINVLDVLALFL